MGNLVYDREYDRVLSIERILAEEISENIAEEDTVTLLERLEMVSKEPFIMSISVIDSHGVVRFSTDSSLVGSINPHQDSENIREAGELFYSSYPVQENDQSISHVQIGYSLHNARRELRNAFLWGLFLDIIIIGLTLLVAWTISGLLITPLTRIRKVASDIAAGDFSVRLASQSNDEIGKLNIAINDMAISLADLTAHMQQKIDSATRELSDKNKRLEELDRLKSDFVTMVSHELRTPLTSIIGFAKTLIRLDLPADQRNEFLNIIVREGHHLAFLVEEYLNVSKIESGQFQLNKTWFDLTTVLAESGDPYAGEEQVTISHSFSSEPVNIFADRERIKRVIQNLIDNAIKYAGPCPEINITLKQLDDSVKIIVSDNGPGISEQDQLHIFDKFYRGISTARSQVKGAGLGLSIVRVIVEAHNGSIAYVPGDTGATFEIILPIQDTSAGRGE